MMYKILYPFLFLLLLLANVPAHAQKDTTRFNLIQSMGSHFELYCDTLCTSNGRAHMMTFVTQQREILGAFNTRSSAPYRGPLDIRYIATRTGSSDTMRYTSLLANGAHFSLGYYASAGSAFDADFKSDTALVMGANGYCAINQYGEEVPINWRSAVKLANGWQRVSAVVHHLRLYALIDKTGQRRSGLQQERIDTLGPAVFVTRHHPNQRPPYKLVDTTGSKTDYGYESIYSYREGIYVVGLKNKYGLADSKGKLIAECIYDNILPFSEGLAAACLGNKWGYLNPKGKQAIAFKYHNAASFSEGMGAVMQQGKWGYISKKGTVKIPLNYVTAQPFKNSRAVVCAKADSWGVLNKNGHWAIRPKFTRIDAFKQGMAIAGEPIHGYCMIDSTGNEICFGDRSKNFSDYIIIDAGVSGTYFPYGAALAHRRYTSPAYGLCNKTGQVLVEFQAASVEYMYNEKNDLLPFLRLKQNYSQHALGLVDYTGKMALECKYSYIQNSQGGLMAVQRNGKWGFIDHTFSEVIEPVYDEIREQFTDGLALVQKGMELFYINTKGGRVY